MPFSLCLTKTPARRASACSYFDALDCWRWTFRELPLTRRISSRVGYPQRKPWKRLFIQRGCTLCQRFFAGARFLDFMLSEIPSPFAF
jgi:hypothetical protein